MLQVQHASVHYHSRHDQPVHALDNVTLDLPPESIVVALGASGCGKSTLLNAIAGFLPLSHGDITLDGKKIAGPGVDRGVVFQKDTLLPWLNVWQNVALGLKFAGLKRQAQKQQALELLSLVGLDKFSEARPYELSGGMRQRVGIARALATDPKILLMDEPFGALDSLTRENMQTLLAQIWQRTRKQIFLITHSIDEALCLGTQIVVMSPRPGRVVARFETDFLRQSLQEKEPGLVKFNPQYKALRQKIRAIIHNTEHDTKRNIEHDVEHDSEQETGLHTQNIVEYKTKLSYIKPDIHKPNIYKHKHELASKASKFSYQDSAALHRSQHVEQSSKPPIAKGFV